MFLKILKVRVPFCQHFSSQLFVIGVAQHQPTTFYHAQQWMRYAEDYLDTMRKELLAVNHSPSEAAAVALQMWHTVALANQKLGQELGWPQVC